jgi:hypothetical protein
VATEYFSRTEALITQFRSSSANGELTEWAQKLLVDTRLLLDSPVSHDPELKYLLKDLEIVLAQIVQLQGHREQKDIQWINDGLNRRAILMRLRMNVPPGLGTQGV